MSMVLPPEPDALQRGDALPFFEVVTVEGVRVRYQEFWQKKNVVLVCVPIEADAADARYLQELSRRSGEFARYGAACIITRETIPGVSGPAVAVADRWGEIQYIARASDADGLPAVGELLDTLDYVQRRCPECEGEAR